MTFHLMCVRTLFLVRFRLLSGHLLTICSLCVLAICNISYFPVMILRAGFEF